MRISVLSLPFITALLLVTACQSLPEKTSLKKQPLPLKYQDHALAERIYAVKQERFIEQQELFNELPQHEYILLGETHDNSRHHAIQREIIQYLGRHAVTASVSFEMIDNAQAEAIGNMNLLDVDTLMQRLNQSESGWDYETYYEPLFSSAIEHRVQILAANIEKQKLIKVLKNADVILDEQVEALMNDVSLNDKLDASLRKEIVDSHCGMIDDQAAGPMVKAQRLRDVTMALSLLNSQTERRILIAGSGHVRRDRGVPYYLLNRDNDAGILALGMIEVNPGMQDVEEYRARWDNDNFPFDYIWFTAGADREDPCLVFHARDS